MAESVVFTQRAEKQLDAQLHYLLTNYGAKVAQSYYTELTDRLQQLLQFPESGRLSNEPGVRYVQIKRMTYLYYAVSSNTLFVVALYGVRRQEYSYR